MSRLCALGHTIEREYVSPGYCPVCRRTKYLANKEHANEQSRAWYAANKSHHKELMSSWYEGNPDRMRQLTADWYQRNREAHLERARVWAKEHKEEKRLARKRRRELESEAPGWSTDRQVADRIAYFGWKCVYCSGPFEEVDHQIPISRGGCAWPANLVPSCRRCNRKKWTKTALEFRATKEE